MFIAPNPPMGAVITYWLREYTDEEVKISIARAGSGDSGGGGGGGHVVRKLTGTSRPGLNRVVWDLMPEKDQRLGNPDNLPEFVPAGAYEVTVSYGKKKERTVVEVLPAD